MLRKIFDNPTTTRMLDTLLETVGDHSKTEISRLSGISLPSLYTHWSILEEYNIVLPTRQLGASKMFKLNTESLIVARLIALDAAISTIDNRN